MNLMLRKLVNKSRMSTLCIKIVPLKCLVPSDLLSSVSSTRSVREISRCPSLLAIHSFFLRVFMYPLFLSLSRVLIWRVWKDHTFHVLMTCRNHYSVRPGAQWLCCRVDADHIR